MRRLAFVTPFSSVHRCFFVDVRFIEDSLPSCATRFKQFCWISGTKPGVENRLHADHEMAKLDKAETLTAGARNANRHLQLSPRWKPEALRSLVTSDPQSKTRSGAGAGMSSAPEFSQ